MTKPPVTVTRSAEEGEALIGRVHASGFCLSDGQVVEQVIRRHFWLMWAVQEAKRSLQRFRQLLLGEPTTTSRDAPAESEAETEESPEAPASSWATLQAHRMSRPRGGHRSGQGRLGAEAYRGAERLECRHETLAVGQRCPVWGQGNVYELPSGVERRIDGHAVLRALRYARQKLRCSAWGHSCTASLPAEAGEGQDSARARAVLVVSRDSLGLPLYRLPGYQAMLGVPGPEATQWDQIEKVGDWSYVVCEYLETVAAGGELSYQDDTSVRLLSLMAEHLTMQAQAEAMGFLRSKERTGMFTTALVVQGGERTICLYDSGRSHAGENLAALLTQREADQGKPLVMSEALARNEVDATAVMRCHCLAHGRRQCSDREDVFPGECQVVIEALKQVFDPDEEARDKQMSAEARLVYHQDSSRPILDALQSWLDKQLDERLVEPNSSLGKAMASMQGHWETLSRFVEITGAPLDNNLVERALKLFIRQRKNSLFYTSAHSASSASVLTSLIATCLYAGVSVLEYLVALQEHRREVFAEPEAWLPWTYQASLAPP